jgi:hypothetical protein
MRIALPLLFLCAMPTPVLACTPSAGGTFSYEITLSPRAGGMCAHIVTVYEGASCSGAEAGHVEVGCNLTSRLAIRDDGVLVSILAPRTSRRAWNILRVFWVTDADRDGYLRLDDLPATSVLRGTVRVRLERGAVVFADRRRRVRVALDELPH